MEDSPILQLGCAIVVSNSGESMQARRRHPFIVLVVAAVLVTAACGERQPPLPPIAAVGNPVFGPNPPAGTPGEQVAVLRSKPYTVAAATGPGHHQSGVNTPVEWAIPKPCGDCYITRAVPRLMRPDGTEANLDTGLMLHHFAQFNSGAVDVRCGTAPSQLLGEIWFNGGNERTQGWSPAGTGYRVRPTDVWSQLFEVMNMNATEQQVVFEMTYHWVPASTPGMHALKPVWIDVTDTCANSEFPAGVGRYSRKNTWTVTVPGRIMGMASHLHDGGTHTVLRNLTTGAVLCDSQAHYGGSGYEPPDGGHHGASHLSSVDQCAARSKSEPVAVIARGDVLEIEAFYDADAHPHEPGEPVMGVFFLFVLPEG
jgi:hypothetical protein